MEKNPSFVKNGRNLSSPRSPPSYTINDTFDRRSRSRETIDDDLSQVQISHDIDQFITILSTIDDKSNPPDIPDYVETFSRIVESRIDRYNPSEINRKFGKMMEEDEFFIEAVMRMSKLADAFSRFPSNATTSPAFDRISMVLQSAMAFLEEEFRSLLEDGKNSSESNSDNVFKNSSFNYKNQDQSDQGEKQSGDFPAYSSEAITKMNKIASAMISAGYETECCQVYSVSRRIAFNEQMKKLEFEKINMDDVLKLQWETLEGEISRWIRVVQTCSGSLFPGEKKLGESIFTDHPLISRSLFTNLARAVVIQLLDFAEAVSMAKRSAEKLFKFLDVYETLQNLIPAINDSCSHEREHELTSEIAASGDRIGESAVNIFCDLENSIKSDVAKSPVPGGAVHPLTRYVMNYLKYACEYKDTLEKIFEKHANLEISVPMSNNLSSTDIEKESESPHNFETVANKTPFTIQVVTVMDLLDTNLEAKSKLYRDPSLRYIFLMNNGRYILQKVKGSTEVRQVMGDTWCRRRSTVVRQFHKNYQRETWSRILLCLSHDGLQVKGKVNKSVLKERFKIFTTTFEEIHKTQSTWVVSDEQLQSELQVSITAIIIPAYRSFIGRFRQYLDNGKVDKYIKYQPEDIETLIEGLFYGNSKSMGRRRT
ncbi:exocyst complex component EXO70B1 [Olea europaea var. sylvestris]|uniref:Exocyst subunit Exo70 family protein n=1 Tax=Olea europaea subsp. europaea TaxID=158383 RepID=A0A8S0UHD5_OLEEU|nr:exocyst complex component EXO70B1 [Olea europaea var. sylvestris]CAA3017586.1 exocyst complex component EXO70B1-like [Olea europaea subsp. europaea]